jgi:hypothetical protein
METDDLAAAWDAAAERYSEIDTWWARFNINLLDRLQPRWGQAVRPDTSMSTLHFTRPGTTGYKADERVEVEAESEDRVRMQLVRKLPRRSESRPGGQVTITGDYTKPVNALPAVEALLHQIATLDQP